MPAVRGTGGQAVYVGVNPYPYVVSAALPLPPVSAAVSHTYACLPDLLAGRCCSARTCCMLPILTSPQHTCVACVDNNNNSYPTSMLQPGRVWERVVDTSLQPPDDALMEGGTPVR